ncbi:calcium-transporting ATPase 1 [Clostridium homopropionicum DSM 5847]|uniref:P-type Ca(2+) transporter n=1 Tax=Clostridium homopropionicum DSM 5847 TaxID=1121318 RepID=A0A0L6ZDC8_9CLOT|nr:calcium-translocating P-type ATPase, PMCA-type [Clostridium homopropionicum]KOA20989.1 calcium-transporting ATPase 1 [Clostridium homopropionicum DSM 5847]SFG00140.1 Ca2+-transporting ATPase [Clostridium homopropionicum]
MGKEKDDYRGLTNAEVEKSLKENGPNVLKNKKKVSYIKIFLEQFNDFIIWVLIAATVLSAFIGEKADAITIIIIVVMNAILGFIQEYRTEKSLEALKNLAAPTAKVIRNDEIKVINAEFLVPKDLIILESGDRIPADCELIEGNNLLVDESLLTGESVGVEKGVNGNKSVFMGTIVLRGKGTAKVVKTGMKTEMGKIANMLDSIESEKSPLKQKLAALGKVMVFVCIVICILVTLMGILRGQNKYEMFLLGVSLAVAAIPEGMAAIVTVALALGVSRMLKRNALIRKLPAVETLGCTSIICSDKTGTLTQNNMTVEKIYFNDCIVNIEEFEAKNLELIKKALVYCNDCAYDFKQNNIEKALMGDPTETALIKAFFKDTKSLKEFLNKGKRIFDIPFDSNRKMMSVVFQEGNKKTSYVKGAPERIIERCKYILMGKEILPFDYEIKRRVIKQVENMSYNALRCIAAAYTENTTTMGENIEQNLIFIGIAGMKDPPRPEAKDAVIKCKMAGIRPVMITGDHKNTAFAIAKELGICKSEEEVMVGEDIDSLSEKELLSEINKLSVFARVSPKHKLRIVKAFKKKNNIVAMTGDGVNDAPAVKEADIGVSMGISGTDVTKEASSMILLDDNFATIVSAVEEGRTIYDNIRKFIRYLLSCNLGEVLTMFLASIFYLDTPLLPIQILFVNLATDGLPAIALGVDPPDKDIMQIKPRSKGESVFARGLREKILLRGSLIGICTVLAFLSGKYYGMSLETCRTIALCTLVMSQLMHVFECRSEKHSIFEINILTNPYLVGAVLVSVSMLLTIIYFPFMQTVFHTVPLDLGQWILVLFFSGTISFINSIYLFLRKR